MTGKMARTTGTAPRRPAQPSSVFSCTEKPWNEVDANAATGRATKQMTSASSVPCHQKSSSVDGKTRIPSVRNIAICATHASPSWKAEIAPRAGICPVPSTRPAR